jgi:hypothetical protein
MIASHLREASSCMDAGKPISPIVAAVGDRILTVSTLKRRVESQKSSAYPYQLYTTT